MKEKFLYEYSLWVPMASVNISIKKEAYNFLSSLKTNNKSFSDIILEFKKGNNLTKYFGVLKDINYDNSIRTSFNRRFK